VDDQSQTVPGSTPASRTPLAPREVFPLAPARGVHGSAELISRPLLSGKGRVPLARPVPFVAVLQHWRSPWHTAEALAKSVAHGVLATVFRNLALLAARSVFSAECGNLRPSCLAVGFRHRFSGFSDFLRFLVRRGVLATVFRNLALLAARPVFRAECGNSRPFCVAVGFRHRFFGFSAFVRFLVRQGVLAIVFGPTCARDDG